MGSKVRTCNCHGPIVGSANWLGSEMLCADWENLRGDIIRYALGVKCNEDRL